MNWVSEARQSSGTAASVGRVETLMLEGEMGTEELAQVSEELFRRLQRGLRQVVLDFSEVPHLDYRGVRPLMGRVESWPRAET
jgi:anti-anti-sigma regulatory factor